MLAANFSDTYKLIGQPDIDKTHSMPKSYVTYRKTREISDERKEQARLKMLVRRVTDGRYTGGNRLFYAPRRRSVCAEYRTSEDQRPIHWMAKNDSLSDDKHWRFDCLEQTEDWMDTHFWILEYER